MQEIIQTTQTKDKQYPKLFDSFFDKELDYKNDFVVYIEVTPTQDYNIQNDKPAFEDLETINDNFVINTDSYRLKSGKYIYFTTVFCFESSTIIKEVETKSSTRAIHNHLLAIEAFKGVIKWTQKQF